MEDGGAPQHCSDNDGEERQTTDGITFRDICRPDHGITDNQSQGSDVREVSH